MLRAQGRHAPLQHAALPFSNALHKTGDCKKKKKKSEAADIFGPNKVVTESIDRHHLPGQTAKHTNQSAGINNFRPIVYIADDAQTTAVARAIQESRS